MPSLILPTFPLPTLTDHSKLSSNKYLKYSSGSIAPHFQPNIYFTAYFVLRALGNLFDQFAELILQFQ